MNRKITLILILLSIFLISTGWTDLDWQLVSYRYSETQRQLDYWEFCPFLRLNWWLAYIISVGRIMTGFFVLGWVLSTLSVMPNDVKRQDNVLA